MAQGNLGYKSGKERFAIYDIIYERKMLPRDHIIDLHDTENPEPVLHYLITMTLGTRTFQEPDETITSNWDQKLNMYVRLLHTAGLPTRRINGMVVRIMNKVRLGVENYRMMTMGGPKQIDWSFDKKKFKGKRM